MVEQRISIKYLGAEIFTKQNHKPSKIGWISVFVEDLVWKDRNLQKLCSINKALVEQINVNTLQNQMYESKYEKHHMGFCCWLVVLCCGGLGGVELIIGGVESLVTIRNLLIQTLISHIARRNLDHF